MNKNDYIHFRNELIAGEQANLKDFEKESANFFEACLPIEEIARRGIDTMREDLQIYWIMESKVGKLIR